MMHSRNNASSSALSNGIPMVDGFRDVSLRLGDHTLISIHDRGPSDDLSSNHHISDVWQ
jgi:hypothetical protein